MSETNNNVYPNNNNNFPVSFKEKTKKSSNSIFRI